MGGSDTVVLPTSFDGISYPLFPLFGAPAIASGIMWDPSQTFVVGSAADTSATIDKITAGTPSTPTLGSYKIQVNGPATATITLYDNSNAINNTITLGSGNDTVNLNGNGNSTVTAGSGSYTININGIGNDTVVAGPGNGNLNISGGANVVVSSTFSGSANIGANSTLEFHGAAIGPGHTIAFTSDGATLKIDGTTMPTQTITGFLPGGHDHSLWVASCDWRHRPRSQQRARGLYDGSTGIRPEARSKPDFLRRLSDQRDKHHAARAKRGLAHEYGARYGL